MSTETKTFETIKQLREALPDLPPTAVIFDRDEDQVPRADLHEMSGTFAPYTVEYETPATPAPLDPTAVKVGDTVTVSATTTSGAAYEIAGVVWEPSHSPGHLWVGPIALDALGVTLTAHQPAPKPEWKPGTSGAATVRGVEGVRVMRVEPSSHDTHGWVSPRVPTSDGLGFNWLHSDGDVTDFVPDEPRALPTREAMAEAMHDDRLPGGHPRLSYLQRLVLADAIIANQRGESR